MNPTERHRLAIRIAVYTALGLGWAGFARWIVPRWLAAEHPGPFIEALVRFLHVPPMPFLIQDPLGQWREFSGAVLIAMLLHFAIATVPGWSDRDDRASRLLGLVRSMIAMAFLAVAVLAPRRQDYFFYLEMWYHVRHGNDPWFIVAGKEGPAPLNAYGPLFNLLAFPAGLNTLAPRLLFSAVYILFAIATTRAFEAGRPPSAIRALGCLVLFWNPFAWVEVAFYGHFDLLVGLACVGAARAWAKGLDVGAGLSMAAGVLLKYLPIVLLPFLALDRDRNRPRLRFLATALGAVAIGLGLSYLIWGPSTFSPLKLAANRRSAGMSFFRYLHGRYSPLPWLGVPGNYEELAPLAQLLALWGAWRWSRARKPDVEASTLVAVLALVLLYRVGYPQYQMVPFVMAAAWILRHWDRLRNRIPLVVMMGLYFGWIAACDVAYMLSEAWGVEFDWHALEDASGLPIFLLGSALVAGIIRATTPETRTMAE